MVLSIQQQQKFFSSYSFNEGVRITAGIMVPIAVSIWLGYISWGILAAIGALAAGISDVTGPPHHRFNGMLAATGFLFVAVWITLALRDHQYALAVWLLLASFFFSYILLYGNRAGQVGSGVMLVVVIMTDQTRQIDYAWVAAGFVSVGAIFYMAISLLFDRIRPYRLAQQLVGETLILTGSLYSLSASYFQHKDIIENLPLSNTLAQQQITSSHERVREVLFKTKSIVKDSTHKGRVLLLTFMDAVDLFESIISLPLEKIAGDKRTINSGLNEILSALLQSFGNSLNDVGVAFQLNKAVAASYNFREKINELEVVFEQLKQQSTFSKDDISFFIELRTMFDLLNTMSKRIELLHSYSGFDKDISTAGSIDFSKFVMPSAVSINSAIANFAWSSNIFRYACRVSAAIFVAYLVSLLLPLGHEYWLLLTVLVILKPAYSITAGRNRDRLFGTAVGVAIGFVILRLITLPVLLLLVMLAAMIGSFSLMRNRYFISVVLVTVFVLIAFRLLQAGDLHTLIADRMLDTFLGSVTALLFMWFIPPLWEKQTIASEAAKFLHAANAYAAAAVQNVHSSNVSSQTYKYLRKQAYVEFGNFSDSFQRMNQEPQWMRQHGVDWYQMVVSCNTLLSNTAALSASKRDDYSSRVIQSLEAYTKVIGHHLHHAIAILQKMDLADTDFPLLKTDNYLKAEAGRAMEERMKELQDQDGGNRFKEKLLVLNHLESMMDNLEMLSRQIRQVSEKVIEQ